ncbi:laccase-14-like [Dorcoceras hygrometricum]|uniref:Laccase-14-like n=1 Tax=Dorcoceras hygrometricum TaxID=472368 RepID=A0A2Z7AJ98_9LAMI|nr:laccase-14-like [Dorcoceras hygrometricum]
MHMARRGGKSAVVWAMTEGGGDAILERPAVGLRNQLLMVRRRRFDKLERSVLGATLLISCWQRRFLSIPAFVFDDFGGAGFLVSCSVDCYSLEVVERLVEVSVKLLVYEDFWRNLIERSLIVVRFWIFSSRESLPCLPSHERSGCLGSELQRLVRTLLRCVVPETSNAIIGVVTTGFECLPPSCDGLTGSEDHGPMISPVDTSCDLFRCRRGEEEVGRLDVPRRILGQFQGVSAVSAEPGEIWLPRPCVVPEKSNAIIGVVTIGFECLPPSCDGLTGSEDHGPMISPVDTPCGVSMTFRVVRTNQYNQDLGLIHSTNGNHLESPNEGSSIDHQVTIYLHAQNITMFPTNETWYFASQILVSSSGGLILILTAQSTRN